MRARPEDGSLHYLLGRAYNRKARTAEAKTEFDAAARWKAKFRSDMIALDRDCVERWTTKNQADADASTRELSARATPIFCWLPPRRWDKPGCTRKPSFLNKTIGLNPKIPEAHYDLARAYIAMDNRPAAIPELEKAVEIKPDFYEAQLLLGTLLVDEGERRALSRICGRPCEVRADNPKLLMMLGLQYYRANYFADAIEILKKAAALEPENPDPRYLLIQAYYRNYEYERALTWRKRQSRVSRTGAVALSSGRAAQ